MLLVLVSSSRARALVARRGPNATTAATPTAAVPTPSRNRRRLIVASNLNLAFFLPPIRHVWSGLSASVQPVNLGLPGKVPVLGTKLGYQYLT